jgi:hypothetical protein
LSEAENACEGIKSIQQRQTTNVRIMSSSCNGLLDSVLLNQRRCKTCIKRM